MNNQTPDAGSDEDVTPYRTVSFENEIVPILKNSCILSGCHGERGVTTFLVPKGLKATPSEIALGINGIKGANGTLLISPGKPSQSLLLQRILAEENSMPPLSDLPVEQKNDLNFWVAQGAKY